MVAGTILGDLVITWGLIFGDWVVVIMLGDSVVDRVMFAGTMGGE